MHAGSWEHREIRDGVEELKERGSGESYCSRPSLAPPPSTSSSPAHILLCRPCAEPLLPSLFSFVGRDKSCCSLQLGVFSPLSLNRLLECNTSQRVAPGRVQRTPGCSENTALQEGLTCHRKIWGNFQCLPALRTYMLQSGVRVLCGCGVGLFRG